MTLRLRPKAKAVVAVWGQWCLPTTWSSMLIIVLTQGVMTRTVGGGTLVLVCQWVDDYPMMAALRE